MSETLEQGQRKQAIQSIYASGMDPTVVHGVVATEIVFDATPGFPHAGVYTGWDEAVRCFFAPLSRQVSLQPVVESLHAADDYVFAVGHYRAATEGGRAGEVRFVHAWQFEEQQAVRLRQTADGGSLRDLVG